MDYREYQVYCPALGVQEEDPAIVVALFPGDAAKQFVATKDAEKGYPIARGTEPVEVCVKLLNQTVRYWVGGEFLPTYWSKFVADPF